MIKKHTHVKSCVFLYNMSKAERTIVLQAHRRILLRKPIVYKSLNGNTTKYDCLLYHKKENGLGELILSVFNNCPAYREIRLTPNHLKQYEDYVPISITRPSAKIIIPELIKQGILEPHPDDKMLYNTMVYYPLFKLNFERSDLSPLSNPSNMHSELPTT